jgi:hypothetical protein
MQRLLQALSKELVMFLLIMRSKMGAKARLAETFEIGVHSAQVFVGHHNPVDSCSSEPQETRKRTPFGPEFHTGRSSSFGHRSAAVVPISTEHDSSIA